MSCSRSERAASQRLPAGSCRPLRAVPFNAAPRRACKPAFAYSNCHAFPCCTLQIPLSLIPCCALLRCILRPPCAAIPKLRSPITHRASFVTAKCAERLSSAACLSSAAPRAQSQRNVQQHTHAAAAARRGGQGSPRRQTGRGQGGTLQLPPPPPRRRRRLQPGVIWAHCY